MSPKFTSLSSIHASLSLLLSKHDDKRHNGFITHLDRASLSHKRRAFIKGLFMNLGLLIVIVWLISATITRDIFSPLETPTMTALCVTQDVIILWAIYSMLITTTIPFFFGECRLRLRHGFRPIEVVFRKPPVLDQGLSDDERIDQYRRFVSRAMNPHLAYTNPWSFMTCELWVPAYPAIMEAYGLIDNGEIDQGGLEAAIWKQDGGEWSVYEISKMDTMV